MHCDAGRLESNGFERQAGLVLPKGQYQALRAQGVVRDTPSRLVAFGPRRVLLQEA
jgi:hypothetical protein